MDFLTWSALSSQAGILTTVVLFTQLTKDFKLIKKMPTQLWSFILAMGLMFLSYYFTNKLTISNIALIPFNSLITALSASGGFHALNRAFPTLFYVSTNTPKSTDTSTHLSVKPSSENTAEAATPATDAAEDELKENQNMESNVSENKKAIQSEAAKEKN